jgi:hypothetical protein
MVKLLSAIFFAVGAFEVLAAFIPRLRSHWARTRIPCGFLGCVGVGSAFMGLGVDHFFSGSLPSRYHEWLVRLFFLGLAVGFLGMALDRRRAKRAGMMQGLQTHLIAKKEGDRHA